VLKPYAHKLVFIITVDDEDLEQEERIRRRMQLIAVSGAMENLGNERGSLISRSRSRTNSDTLSGASSDHVQSLQPNMKFRGSLVGPSNRSSLSRRYVPQYEESVVRNASLKLGNSAASPGLISTIIEDQDGQIEIGNNIAGTLKLASRIVNLEQKMVGIEKQVENVVLVVDELRSSYSDNLENKKSS
jgi:hypothetical protein